MESYLTTSYEKFGIIEKVDSLPYCEVIGDIDILSFIRRQEPHLVSFDGERAYTEHPEELAKAVANKNYELIFIPFFEDKEVTKLRKYNCFWRESSEMVSFLRELEPQLKAGIVVVDEDDNDGTALNVACDFAETFEQMAEEYNIEF